MADQLEHTPPRIGFWKTLGGTSRAILFAGVFCLFASIGFVGLQMSTAKKTPLQILLAVLLTGGIAVVYAALGFVRKFKYMPLLVLAQIFFSWAVGTDQGPAPNLEGHADALRHQLSFLGAGAIISIVAGYVLFIGFILRESRRYFRVHAEMALAAEIHRSLVPPFQRTIAGFEIYGASSPSGEVGGDLVDVWEHQGKWTGYVADVSGHGVSAGVLMAMFKTAVRGQLLMGSSPGRLLDEVHRTLFPLKMPNMFVTAGIMQHCDGNRIEFALAGHPPMLHYHKTNRTVSEYPSQNMPLGILPQQRFTDAGIQCEPGDLLLLLTDGFSEVFDNHGNQLGMDAVKSVLGECASQPLPEIFAQIRKLALNYGRQDDDQTMLLVRYAGLTPTSNA